MAFNLINYNMNNLANSSYLGGYGSFNSGSFGCGGSIFGSILNGVIGGGSYCGGGYGGSILSGLSSLITGGCAPMSFGTMSGLSLGLTALKFVGGIVKEIVDHKQQNSINSLDQSADEIQAQIDSIVSDLGYDSASSVYNLNSPEKEYQDAIDSAQKGIDDNNIILDGITTQLGSLNSKSAEISKSKTNLTIQLASAKDETQRAALQAQITQAEIDLKLIDEQIASLEGKKTTTEEKITKYQSNLETAQANYEQRKAKIDQAKTDMHKLQEQLDAIQDKIENKVCNKGDGNPFTRTSQDNYSKLFKSDGTIKDNVDVSSRDVKTALYNYRNATSETDKAKYKKQFNVLWDNLSMAEKVSNKSLFNAWQLLDE